MQIATSQTQRQGPEACKSSPAIPLAHPSADGLNYSRSCNEIPARLIRTAVWDFNTRDWS